VDLPTPEARRAIFTIHLKKRKRDPESFDLDALVTASDGFSGAEIEQAVVSALYCSLQRKQPLTDAAIVEAAHSTVPLSVARAEDIADVRALGRRFTPVS